jgi:hypothetical protein
MGDKGVFGAMAKVDSYTDVAITILGYIIISEPLKNVDTDLAKVQNDLKKVNWMGVRWGLDGRLQATVFQAADTTNTAGAVPFGSEEAPLTLVGDEEWVLTEVDSLWERVVP